VSVPGNVFDLGLPAIALAALAGVVLDRVLGEVPRWHPLVGFGRLAAWIERGLNRQPALRWRSHVAGLAAWCLAVLPLVAATAWIAAQTPAVSQWCAWITDVIALYFAIGARSLRDHIAPIAQALQSGDLPNARALAARIDDVLNWIPARLTAMSYALLGHTADALRCWRTQAPQWSSPNAGPVMASGAGSLRVQLGGIARYDGIDEARPALGVGNAASADDIQRALALVSRTLWLWLAVLSAGGVLVVLGVVWQVA
jgi:cobalamin biosynthesis protein CobD/CbiB